MKFRLYVPVHNMTLGNVKKKGKKINFDEYRARLTNDSTEFEKILKNKEIYQNIGYHSILEFIDEDATYIYLDGELDEVNTFEEMDEVALGFTFFLLRIVQYWDHYLWAVKDNDIYIRDGFLIAYPHNFGDAATYKASLSAINTTAENLKKSKVSFTDDEIQQADTLMQNKIFDFPTENIEEGYSQYKYVTPEIFIKGSGTNRYIRAFSFIIMARSAGLLPLKIVSYVNALECLFTTSNNELSHRVSERVAILLGDTFEEKQSLFKLVKESYGIRSAIVHGGELRNNEEKQKCLSKHLDEILRTIMTEHRELFINLKDKELDEKFEGILFGK